MDEHEGELARIPAGPRMLVIGWRKDMITIGGYEYELEMGHAADLQIAVDEAVAQARAWADEHE